MTNKKKLHPLIVKIRAWAEFCWTGVWRTPKNTFGIKLLKTLNLSARSFINTNLQQKAQALTYNTILALVPALALIVAIGRGFGLQSILQEELYKGFPAQSHAIETALSFVDSYLSQASQGIFVGVGLLVLIWTIISLLSNIEDTFNTIWDSGKNRSFWRKITDYTAICLLIPILMVCSSGVSILVTTTVQATQEPGLRILTPFVNILLDAIPFMLSCLAFILALQLFPNTKVRFKYSLISGIICGIAFQVLQYLFVSGQLYVSKYNAIYGSFAFLPLLLIWLQLSWLILLFGCLLTYSSQNIFRYNVTDTVTDIPPRLLHDLATIVMTAIIQRFRKREKPLSAPLISEYYGIPLRVSKLIVDRLLKAGLLYQLASEGGEAPAVVPSVDPDTYSLGQFMKDWDNAGHDIYIPSFCDRYARLLDITERFRDAAYREADATPLASLTLPAPTTI